MRLTDDEVALAREAVTCPRWRWMEGMRDQDGCVVLVLDDRGVPIEWTIPQNGRRALVESAYGRPGFASAVWQLSASPDLSDPATVGCLEALVQRVLGHDGVNVIVEPRWGVGVGYRVTRWTRSAIDSYQPMTIGGMGHATKAAALVAALKAAP